MENISSEKLELELRVRCPECNALNHTGVYAIEKDWQDKDFSGETECSDCLTNYIWIKEYVKCRSN